MEPPLWIPPPPPQDLKGRFLYAVRRYGFAVVCTLLSILFLALLWLWPDGRGAVPVLAGGEVLPLADLAPSASLIVLSEPAGATVLLDRDSVGVTPLAMPSLTPGVYILSLQKDQYVSTDTILFLDPSQSMTLDVPLLAATERPAGGRAVKRSRPVETAWRLDVPGSVRDAVTPSRLMHDEPSVVVGFGQAPPPEERSVSRTSAGAAAEAPGRTTHPMVKGWGRSDPAHVEQLVKTWNGLRAQRVEQRERLRRTRQELHVQPDTSARTGEDGPQGRKSGKKLRTW